MATPAVSLLALERAWFDASPKRATGGRHALAGFSYQLALSLKAFFGRVADEDSTATLAFDGLSDLAEFQGDLVYLTQIKRTLNRESQRSALAEFLEIDRFLERDYPAFRDGVCFRVICGRRGAGLDESWDPGRLGLADDEARRWHQIRERFRGYHVEGDPRLELAIQLWKTVPRPYDFVNACIAKLQHLLGLNRGSDVIATALFEDLQHTRAHEKIVGTLLGPRDFERADTLSKRILIGQRPRLADLREGCFMERGDRVQPILEVIQQALPVDSPLRDGGRKVPVVWVSGGSGVGKSALLLQSLREVVCELDLPVIYLKHFAEDLPKAIEQVGSGARLLPPMTSMRPMSAGRISGGRPTTGRMEHPTSRSSPAGLTRAARRSPRWRIAMVSCPCKGSMSSSSARRSKPSIFSGFATERVAPICGGRRKRISSWRHSPWIAPVKATLR